MRIAFALGTLAALALGGCNGAGGYVCTTNDNCVHNGKQGTCLPGGDGNSYCAFSDPSCGSGQRWDDSAAAPLGGQCVVTPDGGVDMATADLATPDLASSSDLSMPDFSTRPATNLSFGIATRYAVGTYPSGVAIGDFNGDGRPDFAVSSAGMARVDVLINSGNGVFASAVSHPVGNALPKGITTGDWNGDGKSDIALADDLGNLVVMLSQAPSGFAQPVFYPAGMGPDSVVSADFNHDGKDDLAVANGIDGAVSVFINNGDGTFTAGMGLMAGTQPTVIKAGDLNGDGKADLVVSDYGSDQISEFINGGSGSFGPANNYTLTQAWGIAVTDIDGDGRLDVVGASTSGNAVGVFINSGSGALKPMVSYPAGGRPSTLVSADLNGDGKPDVAVILEAGPSVLLNMGAGGTLGSPIAISVPITSGKAFEDVASADFNGDGRNDLVVLAQDGCNVLLNTSK